MTPSARRCAATPRVILIGEDVAGGAGGTGEDDAFGGAMGLYKGIVGEFGRDRVIDTPISEAAFIGAAAGAACTGLRPVADLMFFDFLGVCFDQIYNQMAKFRYMFGGKTKTPMVIMAMVGAGLRGGAQHSQMSAPAGHGNSRSESRDAEQCLRCQGPAAHRHSR